MCTQHGVGVSAMCLLSLFVACSVNCVKLSAAHVTRKITQRQANETTGLTKEFPLESWQWPMHWLVHHLLMCICMELLTPEEMFWAGAPHQSSGWISGVWVSGQSVMGMHDAHRPQQRSKFVCPRGQTWNIMCWWFGVRMHCHTRFSTK